MKKVVVVLLALAALAVPTAAAAHPLGNFPVNRYREVVPPERLVSTERWGPDWPETVNTLALTESGGRTPITLTVPYPSKDARDPALKPGLQGGMEPGVRATGVRRGGAWENVGLLCAGARMRPALTRRGPGAVDADDLVCKARQAAIGPAAGIAIIPARGVERLALERVDPRNTSRTCSACGHCDKANRKSQSKFLCLECGRELNADWNAALNIAARGEVTRPMDGTRLTHGTLRSCALVSPLSKPPACVGG